ncbi:MAG: HAD family hydrolase [Candidatus Nezhaarchaeota archaeon]|nr:HAD family hydrolase [Candidatus Nezhaarchaeota archaeon]MCX8141649.1 HAD family hydrolase [Candidatus Nezhaarchaeota archaeon]MDW8049916.1 HAD family hydrolase [Nitrososphaerota archaeon]
MCRCEVIEVISFDLTGTLITSEFVDYFWLELVPQLLAKKVEIGIEEAKRIVYSGYHEVGDHDIRWYIPSYWIERFGLGINVVDAIRMARDKLRFYPGVEDVLRSLSMKYRLVISSNLSREFIDVVIEAMNFKGFERVFSCISDLGIISKTVEFYKFISRKLGVPPERVLHVGDDPEKDYENPIRAGMRAILVVWDELVECTTYPHVKGLIELQKLFY